MNMFSARLLRTATVTAAGSLFVGAVLSAQTSSFNTVPVRSPIAIADDQDNVVPALTLGPNVNVTNELGAQSETSVAVNPTNHMDILTSVNDLHASSGAAASVYESLDGGLTWSSTYITPSSNFCYDTWLAFNANGDAFVHHLYQYFFSHLNTKFRELDKERVNVYGFEEAVSQFSIDLEECCQHLCAERCFEH